MLNSSQLSNIYFITSNFGKLEEARAVLGQSLKSSKLDIHEIQSLDILSVVRAKTIEASRLVSGKLFVDDGGVSIHAWSGFPGPLVKYIDLAGGVDLILHMMEHVVDRSISLSCAIGYFDGSTVHTFIGETQAKIATTPRGDKMKGWDTVFIPAGSEKTFAEMSSDEKSLFSHRRKCLENFRDFVLKSS